jgi:hypothetical protein
MKHEEIEERGMVEAYIRRQLAPEDCAAFEEHYFQCSRCFDDLQMTEKLIQGVDHAVRTGLLDPVREPTRERRRWLPAFAFATAGALVLASALVFVVLVREPEREAQLQQQVQQALAQARASQAQLAELNQRASLNAEPEGNVPVAILTASRSDDSPNQVQLGRQSRRLLVWIDIPPQPAGTRFGITISTADGLFRNSIHGLERNSTGALAASVPITGWPAGTCTVRLINEKSPGQLVAEYRLMVLRR